MPTPTKPKVVSFNPNKAPAHMQQVWIRRPGLDNEFYKTYMKAIPRTGDIIYAPDEKKHFGIASVQWFEVKVNEWVTILNLKKDSVSENI